MRTAFAAVAAMLLARLLKLPKYYWALISTIVIVQSTIPPLTLGWQRFVGTALGAVLGAALATFFRPSAVVYALGILLCGVLAWLLRVGGGLPVCRNYVEYYFADSAGACSLDHRAAPVPGSVA
ncbi:MAG TPA: aromatic acid exporter family protein, partial [Terriglobales bacterium]|nr:aromatic acid exporter family protein [Terriglobales bacterium]